MNKCAGQWATARLRPGNRLPGGQAPQPRRRGRGTTVADFFTEQLHNGGVRHGTFEDLQRPWAVLQHGRSSTASTRKACCAPTASRASTPPPAWWSCARVCYEDWGEDPLPYFEENALTPYSRPDLAEEYPLMHDHGRPRDSTSFHSEHQPGARRCVRSLPNPLVTDQPRRRRLDLRHQKTATGCASRTRWAKPSRRRRSTPTVDPRVIHATARLVVSRAGRGDAQPERRVEVQHQQPRPALRHRAHRFRRAVQERALQDIQGATALTRSARWTPTARRAPSEADPSSFVAEAVATGQEA